MRPGSDVKRSKRQTMSGWMGVSARGVLCAVAAVGVCVSELRAQLAAPEVRGTWISTSTMTQAASPIFSAATTTTSFKRMRDIGLNSMYVDVWRNGDTYYNSPTNAAITGRQRASVLGTRDLLQETILQSHRNQMATIAWFQYGFAAKFGNPGTSSTEVAKYMADRGWLLKDSAGAYTNASNGFSWMNPLVPEVRTYIKGLVADAVRNYDLDGIQFDDRLAWPVQFGYDDYTRDRYLAETGRALPTSFSDANFKAWRAGKVTEFARELNDTVRALRPSLIVSASPAVYPFSYDNYCADWPEWQRQGLFDEIIPQVYRSGFSNFDRDWDGTGSSTTGGQVQYMGTRRGDFAAGIAIDITPTANTWATTQSSINLVRNTPGVAGHVLWYSQGVLALGNDLQTYYNVAGLGQAERPDLPMSQLPASVVGTSLGGNNWQLVVPATGYYDLIAGSADVWRVVQSKVLLQAGVVNFNVTSATQVELLSNGMVSVIPEAGSVVVVMLVGGMMLGARRRV